MTLKHRNQAKPRDAQPAPSRFEKQRAKILDAATRLLNQRGIAGMTLQDVAQQLGLKTTAVSYYFRYKEQLVAAVFEDSLCRLNDMAQEAGRAATPRTRVDRYLKLHFDHFAAAMQGEMRPLAILSEIRTLEDTARSTLIEHYQNIFQTVRGFFGPIETAERKLELTARTQMLNEAIFWSVKWLNQYAVADYDTVRKQFFQIMEGGLAVSRSGTIPVILCDDQPIAANDSYSQFLKIATRSLNEIGYKGTSIDRIAAELNLTKGSFYHHMPSKDDLILQCFLNSDRRFWQLHEKASEASSTSWHKLIFIVTNAMKYQFEGDYPLLRTTAFQALPDNVRDIPYHHSQRTALFLTGLIVDACQEGLVKNVNPLLASHIIMSTINSAFDIQSWAAKQDITQAVTNYLQVIIKGIFD